MNQEGVLAGKERGGRCSDVYFGNACNCFVVLAQSLGSKIP